MPEVTDSGLGDLVASDRLRELLPSMDVEAPLSFLAEAVGDGISVEELFKQIPDRSGNLLKLVWMLERGGLLGRDDRPLDTNLGDRLAAVTEQADDPAVLAALLAWERLGPTAAPEPSVREPQRATATVQPAAPARATSG